MMFYYIDAIEQVEAAEDFPWTVNEYGSRTIYRESTDSSGESRPITLEEVQSKFLKKASDISNDLKSIDPNDPNKKHYYAHLAIVNSDGKMEEERKLGTRVEPEKKEQPEPEPEVEEG